ncbi:Appr-1-p processing protein [Haladaptatus sp. W1]|uniref:macro domain-containing protein n=1 Tax=Haladaptatus sp. W1 TaxID=1897478 RepID=UPI000849E4B3|nr:macro domain-containing protein [Haladaptatus sp. W1]ODR80454.1 Appr-1-p processing protein [Haladaptatus sp. W1]
MEFSVIQGDIAAQRADVLVNAAGTSLRMGSGVAGALRRGANGPINEEAMERGPVELGSVAVTDAYELDAELVVHAAAMPHYGNGRATPESVRDATRNALREADERAAGSVVLPALGCGIAGFDLREGGRIICEEIHRFDPESLEDARLIAYSDEEYETLREVAAAVRSG